MINKTIIVLNKLIDIIEATKLNPHDDNDLYGQNEHFNYGVDNSISEINSLKKFLIDMELKE